MASRLILRRIPQSTYDSGWAWCTGSHSCPQKPTHEVWDLRIRLCPHHMRVLRDQLIRALKPVPKSPNIGSYRTLKCSQCGTYRRCIRAFDPYHLDVSNKKVGPAWWCDKCYQDACNDI